MKEDMCERRLQVKLDKRQINWLERLELLVCYVFDVLYVCCMCAVCVLYVCCLRWIELIEIDWSRWREAKKID